MSITLTVTGIDRVAEVLRRLRDAGQDTRPILADIGEYLVTDHIERWYLERDPDGRRWPPYSLKTLYKRSDGTWETYGERKARLRPGRPMLVWDDHLRGRMRYQVAGGELLVGSDRPYAARQHFGFWQMRDKLGRYFEHRARPWLGLTAANREEVPEIVRDHLRRAIAG